MVLVVFVLIIMAGFIGGAWLLSEKNTSDLKGNDNSLQEAIPLESQEVVEIAQDFLKKQKFADEYDLNSVRVENYSQFWSVWFNKKDQNQKPNKGLIKVEKENGEASWVELY